MNYISTRNNSKKVSFEHVFLKGLSEEGGLFIPEKLKKFNNKEFFRKTREIPNFIIDNLIPLNGKEGQLIIFDTDVIHKQGLVENSNCKIFRAHYRNRRSYYTIDQNRLFFIDFLDCYVDTFLSDLVKLKQDLHHLWAVRNQDVYTVRIHQIYEYIWDKLEVRYTDYLTDGFHILDVMNALRIEPYLTSDSQRVILEGIVKSTELYAISYCSDGGAINQISETKTEVDVVTSYDKSPDGNRSD